MNQNLLKERLIQLLVIAANEYNKLITKEIFLKSDNFVNSNAYILRFYDTNFLHLTGVKTALSPKEYFNKCLNKTITTEDIKDVENVDEKYKILSKLKSFQKISKAFDTVINVQEDFERNLVCCTIATSDGIRTLGFIKAGSINRPMTLLNKNRLNLDKPIYPIKPIIKTK